MANRYGEAALMAVGREFSSSPNPIARWDIAMERLYPTSPTARRKSCPRGAFLGLCEEGLVKSIPAGQYTASMENKFYAVNAATLLAEGKQIWSASGLWRASKFSGQFSGQNLVVRREWYFTKVEGRGTLCFPKVPVPD